MQAQPVVLQASRTSSKSASSEAPWTSWATERSPIPAEWPRSLAIRACSSICSASAWENINEARQMKRDWLPLLLVPVLAVVALPLVGSPASWVTLTVAGLAMGMMVFVMASGLTLTFGLMDVLNFGHGAFIAVGAFVAASVMLSLGPWMVADSFWLNMAAIGPAVLAAVVASRPLGFAFVPATLPPLLSPPLAPTL